MINHSNRGMLSERSMPAMWTEKLSSRTPPRDTFNIAWPAIAVKARCPARITSRPSAIPRLFLRTPSFGVTSIIATKGTMLMKRVRKTMGMET